MIPKDIHYVWIGPYMDSQPYPQLWKNVLTDYNIVQWNNVTAKPYIDQAVNLFGGIDKLKDKSYTYLSDLVRLLILKDHGGVYLDHDIHVIKDFTELLIDMKLVLTYQYDNPNKEKLLSYTKGKLLNDLLNGEYGTYNRVSATVNNCFIAVIKNHEFISKAIDLTLLNHYSPKDGQYAMSDWGVGPEVFTLLANINGFQTNSCLTETINNIRILEKKYLHPLHGLTRYKHGNEVFDLHKENVLKDDTTFAIHMHEHFGVQMFLDKRSKPIQEWYNELNS